MDDDFVDVFPSAGGVGDSPVKTEGVHLGPGSPWPRPPVVSLSIPGLDTGGAAAAVSPAIQGSRGVATRSPAKESVFRSARAVTGTREETDLTPDSPAASPPTLTIDPGGECVPTELEKKRAKLEKYRYECSEVSDSFLYVSGEDAAKQQGLVSSKGITHIINCAGPQCVNYLEYTGRFNFLRLNFYDDRTEDVAWFLYSAFDFIKAAQAQKGRVLVHCVQGVSRSCALAIGWLMLTGGIDYDEAYVRVRQARPICAPNTGFICSLLEWQRRREQPPSSPLLYRTAWHVPRFPNDLVLKLCLHEEDRKHVIPTLAALDSRGCYLLVVPKKSPYANFLSAGLKREAEALTHSSARTPLSVPSPPKVPPVLSSAAERAAAAVAAAAAANAKAAAAVAAAEEAKARAKAAAAEEAVMVAKAVEAGVAIPLKWRESQALATKETRDPPQTRIRISTEPRILPLPRGKLKAQAAMQAALISAQASALASAPSALAVDRAGESKVARAPQDEQSCKADASTVDVYVWEGSQSCSQMLELAKKGARWLREYEGWGSGANAPVVQEGKELPEMLRHLLHPKGNDTRDPPVYGDLTAPSPPPTAGRTPSSRSFPPCPTPSAHGSRRAPVLSPADMPTLSPAGPSPSPGGVGFSPYGCGFSPAGVTFEMPTVSPAGSTAVSPATQDRSHNTGGDSRHDSLRNDSLRIDSLRNDSLCGSVNDSRQNSLVLRCSLASAPEDMEEDGDDEDCLLMRLREARTSSGLEPGSVGCGTVGAGRGRGAQARPKLFELADELGGQGKSGLRWSQLSVFDDQDLLSQCCFLLVSPGAKNFLWVGKAFAATYAQAGDMQQIHALARDVAVLDARRGSDRLLPCSSDVASATLVPGDGNEPEEWWTAFESGYA